MDALRGMRHITDVTSYIYLRIQESHEFSPSMSQSPNESRGWRWVLRLHYPLIAYNKAVYNGRRRTALVRRVVEQILLKISSRIVHTLSLTHV